MSSPQGQAPAGNVLDLGEIPPRLPHHAYPSHAKSSIAPMAPYGATLVVPRYSSQALGPQNAYTSNGAQDHHVGPNGTPLPYMGVAHVMPPTRPSFAPAPFQTSHHPHQPHLSGPVRRTSDGSSAASGSMTGDNPFGLQGGSSASTMCPPGDEHTNALLQSLMCFPAAAPSVLQQQGPNSGGGPVPSGGGGVTAAAASTIDDILAQVQAQGLTSMHGGPNPRPVYRPDCDDVGGLPGPSYRPADTTFRPAGTAPSYGPPPAAGPPGLPSRSHPGALRSAIHASTTAPVAARSRALGPSRQPPPPPSHGGFLVGGGSAAAVAAAQPVMLDAALVIKGLNVGDLPLPSSLRSPGPSASMGPSSAPQLLPTGRTEGFPVVTSRGPPSGPLPMVITMQGLAAYPSGVPDIQMCDRTHGSAASLDSIPVSAAAATGAGAGAGAANGKLGRGGPDGIRQPPQHDERAEDVAMMAGSGPPASRTRRPRADATSGSTGLEQDSSSLRGGEDGSADIMLRASALTAGPSRQGSGGLQLTRAAEAIGVSPRRPAEVTAAAAAVAATAAVLIKAEPSEGSGQEAPSDPAARRNPRRHLDTAGRETVEAKVSRPRDEEDEDEDGDGEDETTDGEALTQQQQHRRKRVASQRRRVGSATAKKELCRERNRTAQRRFRERQKDLIRVLQEKVEHQEALIRDLESRLAVYEKPPPRTAITAATASGSGGGGDEAALQQQHHHHHPTASNEQPPASHGDEEEDMMS